MVFKHLKIRPGPVQNGSLPLWEAPRYIPGWLHHAHFLPRTMGLQVCLRHHVNAVLITEVIPGDLVGVMAGTDCIDMVPFHARHIPGCLFPGDAPPIFCAPLMAVHAIDHQAPAIEANHLILYLNPAEPKGIGHDLHQGAFLAKYTDFQAVEIGIPVIPRGYLAWHPKRAPYMQVPVRLPFAFLGAFPYAFPCKYTGLFPILDRNFHMPVLRHA